ncbi:hypothetical protein CLLI_22130 [Clostridium liquoris]|jgi:hypothetical protein|uniref:Uncharacterized protein n=1 Tax=Clostridium liquoris TaxID=1289519 RepID=A0A2T0B1L0_9CLOT|nr:hypothetical protein CLLI_22130 [Clostridium liquoris]
MALKTLTLERQADKNKVKRIEQESKGARLGFRNS